MPVIMGNLIIQWQNLNEQEIAIGNRESVTNTREVREKAKKTTKKTHKFPNYIWACNSNVVV